MSLLLLLGGYGGGVAPPLEPVGLVEGAAHTSVTEPGEHGDTTVVEGQAGIGG
jgi:hypothetical protein